MKLKDLIDNIMNKLNFNELEIRENNAGCDFKGTLDHYRSIVKDSIKDTLVSEKISNTENIYVYAMEWLREKNDLKIYDAELKIKYDHYMNEQKASSTKK